MRILKYRRKTQSTEINIRGQKIMIKILIMVSEAI